MSASTAVPAQVPARWGLFLLKHNLLEDKRLRIFVTAVECGNFTAAARLLHITQPSVSQNVAELERDLGAQLLVRNRNEVSLTEKGRQFYGYARQILHWYKVAQDAFRPNPADLAKEAVKPAVLRLEDGREVQVWASGSDIHIELAK